MAPVFAYRVISYSRSPTSISTSYSKSSSSNSKSVMVPLTTDSAIDLACSDEIISPVVLDSGSGSNGKTQKTSIT